MGVVGLDPKIAMVVRVPRRDQSRDLPSAAVMDERARRRLSFIAGVHVDLKGIAVHARNLADCADDVNERASPSP